MSPFASNGNLPRAGATTGRSLVLFEEGAEESALAAVAEIAGPSASSEAGGGTTFFRQLGVALVDVAPEQLEQAGVATAAGRTLIEPERINRLYEGATRAPAMPPLGDGAGSAGGMRGARSVGAVVARSPEYLQGYRDAVLHLTSADPGATAASVAPVLAQVDETQATWGLQAVRAVNSCHSGQGIRVAVLDTGFELAHPDFEGRAITSASFIPGEEVQDGHGHGTHCIGTAMGARCPGTLPRYGVACDAEVFAGKVLSDAGSGTDGQILGGIDWALENGCEIISMSLGAPVQVGTPFSEIFERVARRAAARGTLIVAAAGNESEVGAPQPVGHPANCPSILAVAAVDSDMRLASFSNHGLNPEGGQVDLAGPGVAVRSTWKMPLGYRTIDGTSMATPHVAGCAALLAEANPGVRGGDLGRLLVATARRLPLSSQEVGAGLVQAP